MFHRQAFLAVTLSLTLVSHYITAQSKNETVTKTITKESAVSAGDMLSVIGEKADIRISGWNKDQLQLKMTFSATHADKTLATRELEFMRYALTREKNNIELRNAFILPASTDYIQSKVSVLIELMIPAGTRLLVRNKYGNTELSNLTGNVDAQLEFSDLDLLDMGGELSLQCSYSEVHGKKIAVSSLKCRDEKSNIFMELSSGAFRFNSKHSDLDLTIGNIQSLSIESSRTNITLTPQDFELFNYKLVNNNGKIYLPGNYGQYLKKDDHQSSLSIVTRPPKPLIVVSTDFNTLTIK